MRSIWKGSISFGLVSIPVRLYAGARRKNIRFNMLHQACHSRIRYRYWCPSCGEEVQRADTVRGYEYEKGRYVVVSDEEFEKLAAEQNRRIQLVDFVRLTEIDPIHYDSSYYVVPGEAGRKPYALLLEAMSDSGRIGIGRFVMRSKPHLVALRPHSRGLLLHTMYYQEEIRSFEAIEQAAGPVDISESEVEPREKEMAVQLIETLSEPFEPASYRNEYRERVLQYIEQKARGRDIKLPEQKPREVIDLMDALQESLQKAERKAE